MKKYKIVRYFFGRPSRTVKRGLTLEETQRHCNNPETSSSTCKKHVNVRRTRLYGKWFDGYTEE